MNRGFTLLEVLVATLIMGIAVVALLANLSTSLRTGAKLTEYDRATLIARARMDELLADHKLPHGMPIQGRLDPVLTGWPEAGWQAEVKPFDVPRGAGTGALDLERVQLQIWWNASGAHRTFELEAFRQGFVTPEDMAVLRR